VQSGQGAAIGVGERFVVEQDRGSDQWSGQTPSAGLIGTGDKTAPESAVEAE
jgi:hypothetical protein